MTKKSKKVLLSTAAVIMIAAVVVFFITSIRFPFSGVKWNEKELECDGKTLTLKNKKISISNDEGLIWKSPKEYKVEDVLLADTDADGDTEMTVLLWKKGKYGNARPFWEKGKDDAWTQHIFIYDLDRGGRPVSKWFASDIGMRAVRMAYTGNEIPVLIVEDIKGNSSAWIWDSFGMKNIENSVSFIAYGDNIIHKEMLEAAEVSGRGFDPLYEDIKAETAAADIAALNAETILVDKQSAVSGYPQFGSPTAVGEALRAAGFSLVNCANNHAMDKGIYGIDVSADFYKANDMTYVGIQRSSEQEYEAYKLIKRHGISFAVFGYTEHTNGFDAREKYPYAVHYFPEEDKLKEEIRSGKEAADVVVVFAHWGEEYEDEPDEYQQRMAKAMADAGADVVIGTHPHVVQKSEMIKGEKGNDTLVCYSLGNFRAMPGRDERSKIGACLKFTAERGTEGVRIRDWTVEELEVRH
ncbi:MAG: CapA family protein [Lachnospiraceae bacterium]|nr:CapA family protein [Lachnospiraceae bacterium]